MKQSGTITIFLCLVLVSISAVICGLVESARIAGVRFYLQLAADSAIDSVFSEYDNKLWEEYRLISGVYTGDEEIQDGLSKYVKPYVEESGIYQIKEPEFEIMEKQTLTDEGGAWLEEEAYDYMKYKVASDLVLNGDPSVVWKQIKEAESMSQITLDYGLQSRTAVKLEKSLMRIGEYLEAQKQNFQNAESALHASEWNAFISSVKKLKSKCGEINGLVKKYTGLADKLESELNRAELENSGKWEELSEENREILKNQVDQFKPYVEKNGERRVQVEKLPINAEEIAAISEQAINLANYIKEQKEEEENSAADTDGDGSIDYYEEYVEYEEDMQQLRKLFQTIHIADIGFEFGVENEEAADILSSLQEMLQGGVLELVIPADRDVQHGYLNSSALPSNVDKTVRTVEQADILKSILVNEYAIEHFPCFTDNADRDFAYELEYIIAGNGKGGANLGSVVMQLVAIRSGLNYLHIMTDSEKMNQVRALANTIAMAGGIPFLNALIQVLIITVWALVEAVLDVKDLLAGKTVNLIKSPADWHLRADKLLDIGKNRDLIRTGGFSSEGSASEESSSDPGTDLFTMNYKFYLRLLLFIQKPEDKNYRMMDLIQNNLSKSDPGFKMKHCIYGLRTKVNTEFSTVFSGLGLVRNELGGIGSSYKISTEAVKAY